MFDEDELTGRKQGPKRILAISAFAALLFFGNSLAANINLGSENRIEFGQGIQIATACDSEIQLTPEVIFVNSSGAGSFFFKRFTLSNIDVGKCAGVNFALRAYNETSSVALELFPGHRSAVVMESATLFSAAEGQSGLSLIDTATGAFTAEFISPTASAGEVRRLTLESSRGGESVYSNVLLSSFNMTLVAVGEENSCGISNSGALYCWGANNLGQLGLGYVSTARLTPQLVPELTDVTDVSVDRSSGVCALKNNGDVYCWGETGNGRIGDGQNASSSRPIRVNVGSTVSAISTGGGTSCALLSIGNVKCWGYNYWGQVGDGSDGIGGAGGGVSSVLSPVAVSGLSNVTQLSKGSGSTTCALKSNGTIFCWGYGTPGTLGDGVDHSGNFCWTGTTPNCSVKTPVQVSGISTATMVSVGDNHACALLTGGSVKCWGSNSNYKLGIQTPPDSCNNNREVCSMAPGTVPGISSVVAISAGSNNTCVVISGGDVYCWGSASSGALGAATSSDSYIPVQITGISGANDVRVGGGYACAVLANGRVKCWGANTSGQFGNGTTNSSATPS